MADYDSGARSPSLRGMWAIARRLGFEIRYARYDRTKRGWHVVCQWNKDFSPVEAVALQCVLGSDLKREGLNFMRVLSGANVRKWNVLFERKLR